MTEINSSQNLQTFNQIYGTGYQPSSMVSSPVSSNTAPSAPAPNLNNANALEKTPKSDTITIVGKTIKKKTAIMAGLGTLAAAVGAAIVFGAGRGKTPVVPPEVKAVTEAAEAMAQKANELAETAQKKIDTVIELFKNGGKDAEGKVVATIKDSADDVSEKIMEEFAEDGSTVLRRSIFRNDVLTSIEEIIADKKSSNIFLSYGKVEEYSEGYEELPDKTIKIAKTLFFEDGKLEQYIEGYEELPDKTMKTAKTLFFEDGKLEQYSEGHEKLPGITIKTAKKLFFRDGKPVEYNEGYEHDLLCGSRYVRLLELIDGNWAETSFE